jgi:hypothetical protein
MGTPDDATHELLLFAGQKHKAVVAGEAKAGDLLLHLWFRGRHSFQMNLDIALGREDVSRIIIIDRVNHTTEEKWLRP